MVVRYVLRYAYETVNESRCVDGKYLFPKYWMNRLSISELRSTVSDSKSTGETVTS